MLVPALLGYIDKAKRAKYLEEAHSIYVAIQSINSEAYAHGWHHFSKGNYEGNYKNYKTTLDDLIDPTSIVDVVGIGYIQGGDLGGIDFVETTENLHKYYSVYKIDKLKFKSQDGNTVEVILNPSGDIEILSVTAP
nr:hypothetical protein [Lachnospiraceae bacterium]